MQTLAQIRGELERHGLSPRHRFGQNFLIDHNLLRRLVDAAELVPGSLVLEVGPGTGTLTEELLERGCRVVACEIDRGLAALLREKFAGAGGRFTLIEGDCLESKREVSKAVVGALGREAYKLVSNLPYGVGTPLLLALLTSHPACEGMTVTVQKEVGDRLVAGPSSAEYGPLGVVAGLLAEVRRVAVLPPECFWPRPEVTSVMVAIRRRERPPIERPAAFAAFVQRAFANRRKQMRGVLGREAPAAPWPEGISPSARAESLAPGQFVALYRALGGC